MLTGIRITNFNSHEDSEYYFEPGVTWIKGPGGAGKSSIVDALGFGTFGYLAAPKATYIRKGTRVGLVETQYFNNSDIRFSAQRSLHDSDHNVWVNGSKKADTFADSEQVVRDYFALPALIRRTDDIWTAALCMEQDQITAPFLKPPGQRKLLFDGISGVESWRVAWSNLARSVTHLETERKLKEQEFNFNEVSAENIKAAQRDVTYIMAKISSFKDRAFSEGVCPTCGQELPHEGSDGRLQAELSHLENELEKAKEHLRFVDSLKQNRETASGQLDLIGQDLTRLGTIRKHVKAMGPLLSERFVRAVSVRSNKYLARLFPDVSTELIWESADYGVSVVMNGNELDFQANLSGSQRVLTAIAIRLGIYDVMQIDHPLILDEPTINLDQEQLGNVIELLGTLQIPQIIIVSHDQEFVQIADNILEVK